jgi:preprotein translocase subunit SecG
MYEILLMIHVVICAGLVGLILIQQGKGSGMGSLGGGSQSIFGAEGSATFLSRVTALFAVGFFITSLSLSLIAIKQVNEAKQAALPAISLNQDESDVPAAPATKDVQSDASTDQPVVIDSQESQALSVPEKGPQVLNMQAVEPAPSPALQTVPADAAGMQP